MKNLTVSAAVLASLVATGVVANQEGMNDDNHGVTSDTQGSAMSENHQRANTGNINSNSETLDQKMKNEVREDWREDAEERREADVSKPEQR
ncbi:hypothetical protein [Stutzerimonas xanthomarina]|uniref:hypothetical protein n=1 Tax=Stutzerimonas xanthomarina TaxID=271420 RepID=UPI003AA91289